MKLPAGYETDVVVRLEANLDDLTAEIIGAMMEKLLAAGALDVWFTPIQMKKNRPAVMLSALAEESTVERLADIIFSETTTFGLRLEEVTRLKLDREFRQVMTEYGEVTVKLGLRQGKILQASPEFEVCKEVSNRAGVPLKAIYEAAKRAAAEFD